MSDESPVTDEMYAAVAPYGVSVQFASQFYRAMAALAPVELVPAAEDRIAALEAGRRSALYQCW